MATEQYANSPTTTLDGAINGSVTSITVTDGSVFPAAGDYAIRCEDEIMLCTSRSGNVLTVVRGQEATSGASHPDDASIFSPLTARSLLALPDKFNIVDLAANRPTAGLKGRIFRPTDHFIASYDDGSDWINFGPTWTFSGVKPDSGNYTWLNQGSATVTDTNCDMFIQQNSPESSAWQLRGLKKTRNSTGSGTRVTVCTMPFLDKAEIAMCGVGFRESSSGKIQFIRLTNDQTYLIVAATAISVANGGSTTDLGSGFSIDKIGANGPFIWLRLEEQSGVLYFQYSQNGKDFKTAFSGTFTPYFSGSPDELFLFVVAYNKVACCRFFDVKEE